MLSTLLGLGASLQPTAASQVTRAPSVDSEATIEDAHVFSTNAQSSISPSSTPPTSIGDSISVASASPKTEIAVVATTVESTSRRSVRSSRASIATYNVKVLTGTAIHAPKKYSKDPAERAAAVESATRRRTIGASITEMTFDSPNSSIKAIENAANAIVSEGVAALDLQWSMKKLAKSKSLPDINKGSPRKGSKKSMLDEEPDRRKSTRSSGVQIESITKRLSVLGKRKLNDGLTSAQRELKKLADTPEFAKIDTKPVVHEVWSNGKLVVPEPPNKRKKVSVEEVKSKKEEVKQTEEAKPNLGNRKRQKVWLDKGLYAGQEPMDWFKGNSFKNRKDKEETYDVAPFKPTGFLPLPMWHGQHLLNVGRHFQLPFDVCSPLPPGQPKPDEWRKTSSNRFIGEASSLWKKSTLFDSFSSKCVCTPDGGCDVDCQNRIMLYECDDGNCGAGRMTCTNRAFADLQERRKLGGKYRIGVEVIKTADRGYGVRSNRCFDPHQIIVEYTGEIITEDECDRRMNEDYKDNDCYYLMSFDQNMIIDATKGSIARFVNHSCQPNSRMVKWIVGGKPRMALFAGDKPIMSGDELTYDYNFDPFSAKNVQECRCGSENCRGVLGPKPKDPKPIKDAIKDTVKGAVKAGKRKLKELLGGDDDSTVQSPKKRKIKQPTTLKRSASSANLRITKSAKTVRRTVSAQILNVRQAVGSKRISKPTAKAALSTPMSKHRRNSGRTPVKGSPASSKSLLSKTKSREKNVVRTMSGGKVASRSAIRLVDDVADE